MGERDSDEQPKSRRECEFEEWEIDLWPFILSLQDKKNLGMKGQQQNIVEVHKRECRMK